MNGIKNQYTSNVLPRSSRMMTSSYFQPWVFEKSDNQLRLFAYIKNRNVSIFEGKEFGANTFSIFHVIINAGARKFTFVDTCSVFVQVDNQNV